MNAPAYNFAYLDEQTKRMIRRAILKAIAIPGYQVPFASREMPMPYGWGTGGVQVTAAILGPDDVLKVIDQGSDDTTNAISIRKFFEKTAGVATTTSTADATVIQTRHRIPEAPLHGGQVLVYQVPIPEPLRFLEPRETETRRMHALGEYLDEIVTDDKGSRMFVCSDTDYCETRQTLGHRGSESAAPHKERPHG
jgi:alpha-D-ribose 1-methylphosphonate 5-phosphate C-P lyase